MSEIIDIGLAILERARPDLVVLRFKPGSVADAASFQQSMDARKAHCADTPHGVLLMVPDDVDFSPSVLSKDHYKEQGTEAFTRALALVSRNPTFTNILELYYALHPAPFPVKFFDEEVEARSWLEAQLGR